MEAKRIPRRIKKWKKKYALVPWGKMPYKYSWMAIWKQRKPRKRPNGIDKVCRRLFRRARTNDYFSKY